MPLRHCFWALLSFKNFEFIYIPTIPLDDSVTAYQTLGNVLLFKSLFDLIHPEELSLARIDLLNFVKSRSITGVVTRCRIQCIKSYINQLFNQRNTKRQKNTIKEESKEWIVTDMIMYSANEDVILTFFHDQREENVTSHLHPIQQCGNTPLDHNEVDVILKALKLHHSRKTITDTFRLFQIHDNLTSDILISSPSSNDVQNARQKHGLSTVIEYNHDSSSFLDFDSLCSPSRHNNTSLILETQFINTTSDLCNQYTIKEIEKQSEFGPLNTSTCAHHSQIEFFTQLAPFGVCKIQLFVIRYGCLTFTSSQIILTEDSLSNYSVYNSPASFVFDHLINTNTDEIHGSKSIKNKGKYTIHNILNDSDTSSTHHPSQSLSSNCSVDTEKSPKTQLCPYDLSEFGKSTIQKRPGDSEDIDNSENTTSPTCDDGSRMSMPRAWKGRFGAYEKKCENCQAVTSPEWRRGPSGHKTLCNACGLRYARYVTKYEKQQGSSKNNDIERSFSAQGTVTSVKSRVNRKSKD